MEVEVSPPKRRTKFEVRFIRIGKEKEPIPTGKLNIRLRSEGRRTQDKWTDENGTRHNTNPHKPQTVFFRPTKAPLSTYGEEPSQTTPHRPPTKTAVTWPFHLIKSYQSSNLYIVK